MNQKLPLFGLHGDSHVVSLSRNRMYVNLISLENGDCETTFKVGLEPSRGVVLGLKTIIIASDRWARIAS